MALSKNINVSYQFQNNASAPVNPNFTARPVVSGSQLTIGTNLSRPGVFGPGTPIESSASNPTQDSNS